jgi:hypothetical protein
MYSKQPNATIHGIQIFVLKLRVELIVLRRVEIIVLWLLHVRALFQGCIWGWCIAIVTRLEHDVGADDRGFLALLFTTLGCVSIVGVEKEAQCRRCGKTTILHGRCNGKRWVQWLPSANESLRTRLSVLVHCPNPPPNQPPTMNWEIQYGKLQFDQFALVRPLRSTPHIRLTTYSQNGTTPSPSLLTKPNGSPSRENGSPSYPSNVTTGSKSHAPSDPQVQAIPNFPVPSRSHGYSRHTRRRKSEKHV